MHYFFRNSRSFGPFQSKKTPLFFLQIQSSYGIKQKFGGKNLTHRGVSLETLHQQEEAAVKCGKPKNASCALTTF